MSDKDFNFSIEKYPEPTTEAPNLEQLQEWAEEGVSETTDGCFSELDGFCEHQYPSWFLQLGLI